MNKYRVIRRLYGILVKVDGKDARVLFKMKDGQVEYDLPFRPLKVAGVTEPNQPFEYSEVEVRDMSGETTILPEIVALAPASAATTELVPLSPEYQAKRRQVLSYFANKK